MFSREKFIKERNEALFSLDEKKIKRYLKKYGITIPRNEEVFWCTIYKSICNVEGAPQEVKEKAMAWLKEHGSTPKMR